MPKIASCKKYFVCAAFCFTIVIAFVDEANARRIGRFVSSFTRGAAHSSLGHKTYDLDTLTVHQLTECLKRADQLDADSNSIEADRNNLQARIAQIDNLEAAIKRQQITLDRYSQYAVDNLNAEIRRYNGLVEDGRTQQAAFNRKVDDHNQKSSTYNAACAKRYYADDLEVAKRTAGID